MSIEENLFYLIKDFKNYVSDISSETKYLQVSEEEHEFFKKDIAPKIKKASPIKAQPRPNFKPVNNFQAQPKRPPMQPLKKQAKPSEPQKKEQIKEEKKEDFIILEKPGKPPFDHENLKTIITQISPSFSFLLTPPSDEKAKKIAKSWMFKKDAADISILSFSQNQKEILFLKNLAKALNNYYLPTKVISATVQEKENRWDLFFSQSNLKLVIAVDCSIWQMPRLIKFYKEMPMKKEYFFNDTPLFLLPDISLYFKEPLLKKSLWESLEKKLLSLKVKKQIK